MICLGLVAGYFTCYGTARIASSLSWRVPFIALATASLLYTLGCLFLLPPSPRWLIIHGRQAQADRAWNKLGVEHEDRQDLIEELQDDLAVDGHNAASDASPQRPSSLEKKDASSFLEIFSRGVRRRTILAVFLMGFLQWSGIDGVLFVGCFRPGTHGDESLTMRSTLRFFSETPD